jgi:hypothetical protein
VNGAPGTATAFEANVATESLDAEPGEVVTAASGGKRRA